MQLLVKDLIWLRMADRDDIANTPPNCTERSVSPSADSSDASEGRGQDNVYYGKPNPLNRFDSNFRTMVMTVATGF